MNTAVPCSACVTGAVHSGTPRGVETVVHGLKAYVSSPPPPSEGGETTPRGIVVMIPDAFGWTMVNNRLLCDRYSEKGGWLVYLPDFMDGSSLPASFLGVTATLSIPTSWSNTLLVKPVKYLRAASIAVPPMIRIRATVCRPRIVSFFQALRTSPPPFPTEDLKIGVAGFCWGGQHTVYLAQNLEETQVEDFTKSEDVNAPSKVPGAGKKSLIDCAFTAHPAMIKTPDDLEKVKIPLSVSIGVVDEWMKGKDVATMKAALDAKGENECLLLEGAKHGFAVRSWEGDKVQMGFADVAEKQALAWFERWMT